MENEERQSQKFPAFLPRAAALGSDIVRGQGAPTMRPVKHFVFYIEPPFIKAVFLQPTKIPEWMIGAMELPD